MAASVYSKVLRKWVLVEEQAELEAAREAELADDTISYVGKGKSDKLHLIDGSSKRQDQPHARCGLWVSNRNRQATVNDTLCKKCVKGGASFSTYNQPRDCADCGRKFADSTRRDSNDTLCPDCYEIAGLENAHVDGDHDGAPSETCPMCQAEEEAKLTSGVATQEVTGSPVGTHEGHAGQLHSECADCRISLEGATVAEDYPPAEAPSDASVGAALTEIIAATLHKDWLLGTGKPNNKGGQTIQFKMPDGRMVMIAVAVFS